MPLRYLFIDMNSYFASCEQQDFPELRGKPIAVIPVEADTTCCLAASYEAKALGIKTGTPVWRAKQICPNITLRQVRSKRYMEIHELIVKAVERCLPVDQVLSVDEMNCKLLGDEAKIEKVTAIGQDIKSAIYKHVGDYMRCSIGVAPNRLLAKMAGDMKKPNGFTILRSEEIPERMYSLKLTDFPGIGPRMEKRLNLHNVFQVQSLYQMTIKQLSQVWGSQIHGEKWYYTIRGEDVHEKPTHRRTIGQSHILPPDFRSDDGARVVLVRLIHKACARLREVRYWAKHLSISVSYRDDSWKSDTALAACQDTLSVLEAFAAIWEKRPRGLEPFAVSMVLTKLQSQESTTPSLFPEDHDRTQLGLAMDRINKTFGKQSIYFGGLCGGEDTAPLRIPFGNTQLNPDWDSFTG
ncbi:MAG: DNA polymerase Y family protein [Fimbriiglobus sp.]